MDILAERGSATSRSTKIVIGLAAVALIAAVGVRVGRDQDADAKPARAATPDEPLAAMKQRVAAAPDDAEGWRLLGTAHFEAGRYQEAVTTLARAAALQPRRADIWSALGEARVLAANTVGPDAHAAFASAIEIDPRDPRARYFLAVEKDIAGDHGGAVDDWIALLADSPVDAPWTASVRALVEQVAAREKMDVSGKMAPAAPRASGDIASAAIPGPTPAQITAAGRLSPTAQNQMARGMVATLAARLEQNPRDAEGWIRLMRARMVLGEQNGARDALEKAQRAFAGDAVTLARVSEAAQTLEITAPTR